MKLTQLKNPKSFFEQRHCLVCFVLTMTFLTLTGCHSSLFHTSYDIVSASTAEQRSQARASRLINQGLKQFEAGRLSKAEVSFRKALDTAPGLAAAHNNIGNLHLARHELYQAAWEFERAALIAPSQPDPLVNLGMVYEQAGQWDSAADYYSQALELNPNHAIALGNFVRVLVKTDGDPLEINQLLQRLKFIDHRPDWLDWADELLATKYRFPNFSIRDSSKPSPNGKDNSHQIPSTESSAVILDNVEIISPGYNSHLLPSPRPYSSEPSPGSPELNFPNQPRRPSP